MLEFLVNFREANKRPYLLFAWGFLLTTVAVLASGQIAYTVPVGGSVLNLNGMMAVLFTIIPAVYFITMLIKKEEIMEERAVTKHSLHFWRRHEKDVVILLHLFFGVTFAFAMWTMLLPGDYFQVQVTKINQIRGIDGLVTGGVAGSKEALFSTILVNNMQVLGFAFLFSLVFGAGAVFIIVWNASVLGVYIGQISRQLWQIPLVSLNFLPHGIPEVAGYVTAALAGGLISTAVLRHTRRDVLTVVVVDALKVLAVGVMLIVLGSGIEAYL